MKTYAVELGPAIADLVAEVRTGEELVLTDRVQPVAKLVAIRDGEAASPALPQPKFGCLKGQIWMAPDFDEPLEDFREYMA
jgi:antitoxin (DNA-binding transcriptional repressor) of toxin-antitoxin stability system